MFLRRNALVLSFLACVLSLSLAYHARATDPTLSPVVAEAATLSTADASKDAERPTSDAGSVPATAPPSHANMATVATAPIETTVYITRTGEKYHRGSCRYLRQSKIPISLTEAKRQGYTACSVCEPPR
jgi:hypothetical protein